MRYLTDTVISAADASVNQTSGAVDTTQAVTISAHVVMTGTAAGTAKLQASNDTGTPSNWVDVPSATVAVSAAGQFLIPTLNVSYSSMRVVYTFSSGTGTVTVKIKTVGY